MSYSCNKEEQYEKLLFHFLFLFLHAEIVFITRVDFGKVKPETHPGIV